MANETTSSKYDYIAPKNLIKQGSPTVYQLSPKIEKVGSLNKMSFGEKDPTKINKTILLVGETGTGKSTLINSLFNYYMGVKRDDDIWFQIVEKDKTSRWHSQTSDVIVYQIFGFKGKTLPYSLTIIDTPGYGDTRGTEKDDIVQLRLLELFRQPDGVHEISAVGVVVKATENRVSDRLRYIFDSVMSLFGKDMVTNIVALLTHSDGINGDNVLQALEAANIKFAKYEANEPIYFMFNNCQTVKKIKTNSQQLKLAWDLTVDNLEQFRNFLERVSSQNVKNTVEVMNSCIRLTACIQNLQERIQLVEMKKTEIQQTQKALERSREEMTNNLNFEIEVDEPYKVKETASSGRWFMGLFYEGAVCCTVCEENCHYPGCTVALTPAKCQVMKKGRCVVCSGKCPVSAHVKGSWIFVNKTRKVKMTDLKLKKKYEKIRTEHEGQAGTLEILKMKMQKLLEEKDQLLDESFQHILKLEKIALNSYSLNTLSHLDFLIEKMKEKNEMEKIKKLEEIKDQIDKNTGIRAGMKYRYGQMKAAASNLFKNSN